MKTSRVVTINFKRINGTITRYVEGFVKDDGIRLITFSIIPPEYALPWSERWKKDGMIKDGQVLNSVRKYHFYNEHFTILEYRDADEKLLGYYCDIAMPLEKNGEEFFIMDMMLDLWIGSDGNIIEMDWDEFDDAINNGLIPVEHQNKAISTLHWMKENALEGEFPNAFIQ